MFKEMYIAKRYYTDSRVSTTAEIELTQVYHQKHPFPRNQTQISYTRYNQTKKERLQEELEITPQEPERKWHLRSPWRTELDARRS